jgi:hypothetical protein
MKKPIILVALTLGIILIFCFQYFKNQKFDKQNLIYSKYLSKGIFEEKYEPHSGGVLEGNIYSYYITDSTSFRKYIGKCDDKEVFRFVVISNDSVKAVKWSWRNRMGDLPEIPIDSILYSIESLKKEGIFD